MYAVVELQGHQYIVSEWAEIIVDNLGVNQSEKFVANKVLAIFDEAGNDVKVGKPVVDGASVEFEVGVTQKGACLSLREKQDTQDWKDLDRFKQL